MILRYLAAHPYVRLLLAAFAGWLAVEIAGRIWGERRGRGGDDGPGP